MIDRFLHSEPTSLGRIDQPTSGYTVRLNELQGMFADQGAWERMVSDGDPIIYEVALVEPKEPGDSGLSYGVTVLHAGNVGGEFFFTKGHLHVPATRPELYYGLSGAGVILLADVGPDGVLRATDQVRLSPGWVGCVEGRWAHRTVNTGDTDLVFFYVWPSNTGHDYETMARSGFGRHLKR